MKLQRVKLPGLSENALPYNENSASFRDVRAPAFTREGGKVLLGMASLIWGVSQNFGLTELL